MCGDVDPCPIDANDDSDGDGSCDSLDLCQDFDDNLDADSDGSPDACDEFPNCAANFYDCNDVCGGDVEVDCLGDCGGDALLDDCGICNGGNESFDCNGMCTGDLSAGLWFNVNAGTSNTIVNGYGDNWSLSDCFLIESENIPFGDGLYNIIAVYGPDSDGNGCKYESNVFNGSVTITTESIHSAATLEFASPHVDFTFDGGEHFNLVGTGLATGSEDGTVFGTVEGGLVGGYIVDTCGDCVAFQVDSDGDGIADSCDACPGFDDNADLDSDGLADACDACPNDSANDADGDGVCGDVDLCEGYNDSVDFDGDGIPDGCDDSSTGDNTLSINVTSEGTADLNYNSNVDIYGFQLQVSGVSLNAVSGSLDGISFSSATGNVVGFDFTGNFLPAGGGTLVSIEFDPMIDGGTISVSEVVLSGVDGNDVANLGPQDMDFAGCADNDGDDLCNVADDCPEDPENDADGDGVCGDVDICQGYNDSVDFDGDGIPDGCDNSSTGAVSYTHLTLPTKRIV